MSERELDRMVAGVVMGKPWVKPTHGPCCTCQDCGHDHDSCQCNYCTDEVMAFLVVDVMRERGYPVEMDNHAGSWQVFFENLEGKEGHCLRPSLPRAICLAALAALEDE